MDKKAAPDIIPARLIIGNKDSRDCHPDSGGTAAAPTYFATGIVNSAPFAMLSGQRCMMLL
jgi:hypothetical protein